MPGSSTQRREGGTSTGELSVGSAFSAPAPGVENRTGEPRCPYPWSRVSKSDFPDIECIILVAEIWLKFTFVSFISELNTVKT